jgi:hypothetical protein
LIIMQGALKRVGHRCSPVRRLYQYAQPEQRDRWKAKKESSRAA